MGRRPQPGAAGCRAARRRPAEHASAAHLDDAHVVRVSAALAAVVAAVAPANPRRVRGHVHRKSSVCLGWQLRRRRPWLLVWGLPVRHRLLRLRRPSNVATTTINSTTTINTTTFTTTTIPVITATTTIATTITATITATINATISSPGTGGGVTASAAIADSHLDDSSRLVVL